ncbi:MAG: hypothetical protein QXJ07_05610 [Candidatus Bathyarchaeia archaeon]
MKRRAPELEVQIPAAAPKETRFGAENGAARGVVSKAVRIRVVR